MAEFIPPHEAAALEAEKARMSFGRISKLSDDLLRRVGDNNYAEYIIRTDLENATDLMDAMGFSEWLVRPGDRIGTVYATEYGTWPGNNPYDGRKMSLYYGDSLALPNKAERVSLVVSREKFDPQQPPMRYVGVAMDYKVGGLKARQLLGMGAHPQGFVEAVVLHLCERADTGETVFSELTAHEVSYNDVWNFTDCTRELFVLPREVNVYAKGLGHIS